MTEEGNKGAYSHHHCPGESLEAVRHRAAHSTRRGVRQEIMKEMFIVCFHVAEIEGQIFLTADACKYFPADPSRALCFPLFSFSSRHLEQPSRHENHCKTVLTLFLEKCVSYPLNFLGFLFPPCACSTRCSRPLETERTE